MIRLYAWFFALSFLLSAAVGARRVLFGDEYEGDVDYTQCKPCNAIVYINNAFAGSTNSTPKDDYPPNHCGGVLIGRQLVLTNAACYEQEKFPGEKTYLIIGSYRITKVTAENYGHPVGQMYYVERHLYLSPRGAGLARYYNLALLKLQRPIHYREDLYPLTVAMDFEYKPADYSKKSSLYALGYSFHNDERPAVAKLWILQARFEEGMSKCKMSKFSPPNLDSYWCIMTFYGLGDKKIKNAVVMPADLGAPLIDASRDRVMGLSMLFELSGPFGGESEHYPPYYIFTRKVRQRIMEMAQELMKQNK